SPCPGTNKTVQVDFLLSLDDFLLFLFFEFASFEGRSSGNFFKQPAFFEHTEALNAAIWKKHSFHKHPILDNRRKRVKPLFLWYKVMWRCLVQLMKEVVST